jgi:hypothetical protein
MGRTRDVSKILTSNTSILSLASASATYATKVSTGLNLIIPSTIANTSGTASIGTNGTVNFNAASSVSLNSVFNSTYDSYLIFFNYTVSTSAETRFRTRLSGTDASDATYRYHANAFSATYDNQLSQAGQTSSYICGCDTEHNATMQLHNVAKASFTRGQTNGIISDRIGHFSTTVHQNATAYDGFTFFRSSGTMTGKVSVYGWIQ